MKSFSQFIIEKKGESPDIDLNLRRGRIERKQGRELNPKEVKRLKELSPNTKANIEAQARRENLGGYDDGKPTSVRGGKGSSNADAYNQHVRDQRRLNAQQRTWRRTTKTDRAGHIGKPTHIHSTKGVKYKPPVTSKLPKAEQELISQGKARRAKTTKAQDITGIKSKITADDAKRRSLGKSEYSTSTQAKNRYGDITRTTQDSKGRWIPDGSESGKPIREPGRSAKRRSGGPTVDQVKAKIDSKPIDARTIKKPKVVKQSEVSKQIAKQNRAYNLKRNLVRDRVARRNVGASFKKTIENVKRTFGLVTDKAKKDIKLTKDIVNVSRDINRKPPTTPTTPKLPSSTTSATPKLPSSSTTPKGTSAIVRTPNTPQTPKTPKTPKTSKIPTSKTTVIPGTKKPKTPKPKSNWLKNLLNPKAADQVVDVKATSVKSTIKPPKPPTPSNLKSFKDFAKTAGYTPTKPGFNPPKPPTPTVIKPNPKLTSKVKDAFEKGATKTSTKVVQNVGKKGFKAFASKALKTLNPVARVAGYAMDVGDAYKETRAKGGSRARGIAKGLVKAVAYPLGWALGTAGGSWTGPGAFATGLLGAEALSAASGRIFDKIAGPTKLQKAQASIEKQKQELKKKQKTTTSSGTPGFGMGLLKPMHKSYNSKSGINVSLTSDAQKAELRSKVLNQSTKK